jgi:citrate lyase subunit beta/citryl-CoA lyase
MIRSWLFVPADSERKLAKSNNSPADALVFDLEDSVLPERKPLAREMLRAHLHTLTDHSRVWIRVNSLACGELLTDLVTAVGCRPAGIVLPKIFGPEDLCAVEHYLEALEVQNGLAPESIRLAVLVTETPAALLRLGELVRQPHPRVSAVLWGAEDLSSAMGAGDPRDEQGAWRPAYEYARSQALLTAHAWGVEAIDTVYVDFHSPDGLVKSCAVSRHDGFTGRVAIHPNQVDTINKTYSPDEGEVQLARRIVAAFADGAGAVAIDGKMYDIPHLKAASRLLASLETSHV